MSQPNLEGLVLRLIRPCHFCRNPVLIHSVVSELPCPACGNVAHLSLVYWRNFLDTEDVARALQNEPGVADTRSIFTGIDGPVKVKDVMTMAMQVAVGRWAARCAQCRTPYDVPALVEGRLSACGTCGQEVRVSEPDAFMRAVVPQARLLVQCPGLPPETSVFFILVQWGLVERIRSDMLKGEELLKLAFQRPIPADVVPLLAANENDRVRRALASNPTLGADTLDALSRDGSPEVRSAIVHNPSTSPATLAALARRGEKFLLTTLLQREDLPPEALVDVADHPDREVRALALAHASLTVEAGIVLAGQVPSVARAEEILARWPGQPALLEALAAAPAPGMGAWLARRSDLPLHLLERLSQAQDPAVLAEVVANPATPVDWLVPIVQRCGDPKVLASLSGRTNLPWDLVSRLPSNQDAALAMQATHPDAPTSTLLDLLGTPAEGQAVVRLLERTDLDAAAMDKLLRVQSQDLRVRVAGSPLLSPEQLAFLYELEKSPVVLAALASNPRTSVDTLRKLDKYPDDLVLKALIRHPQYGRIVAEKFRARRMRRLGWALALAAAGVAALVGAWLVLR